MFSDLVIRLRSIFRRRSVEKDLNDELRFHFDHLVEKYVDAGLSREEALRCARLEFGGIDQAKEDCWQAQGSMLVTAFVQDMRYALRVLTKSPGFTLIAFFTLALGIGANTTIFSIVDAVLLRPLPYKDADRLVVVWQHLPNERVPAFDTYREFEEWSRSSHSFEELAAATWAGDAGAVLSWHGEKKEVLAMPVSANFFSLLGVHATQGRTFEGSDLKYPCTVVLSHHFLQQHMAGTQSWVGQSLTLDGAGCTVIGIMPRNFSFYPQQTEMWTLITPDSKFHRKPWDMPIGVFGRLRPRVSREAAQAELTGLENRIISEDPSMSAMKLKPYVLDLQSEFTWLTGRELRRGLILLFAVVVFVLLIACVNVANLLLGRAIVRQKDLGIRAALGAGRSRLIRQLLTESVVLSLGGTGLGIVVAVVCVHMIGAKEATQLPPGNPIAVNWGVLLFAAVLAAVTSLLSGLVPAWKASWLDLNEVLKQSALTSTRGARSHRTSRVLVVVEMVLSLVVLAAASLLIESMVRLVNAPLGYRRDHLLTAEIHLPPTSYPKAEEQAQLQDRLELKLNSLPGVKGVAFAPGLATLPGTGPVTVESVANASPTASAAGPEAVSTDYFHVLGVPLLQGRVFSDQDRAGSLPVAIVNEAFVRELFRKGSAIGRRIKFGTPDEKNPWLTIVGIVGDVSYPSLYMGYAQRPSVYRPRRQDPGDAFSVFVRTDGSTRTVAPAIGRSITAVDSNLPVPTVQTTDESLSPFMAEPRFRAQLFGIFAALALVLAAVGIYGVLSQLVSQRKHEVGIRMALGAKRNHIFGLILGEGLKLTAAGIAIGIGCTLALTHVLSSMLYGITATDPMTYALVSAILIVVALLACYVPAWRATRVDPVKTLRCE